MIQQVNKNTRQDVQKKAVLWYDKVRSGGKVGEGGVGHGKRKKQKDMLKKYHSGSLGTQLNQCADNVTSCYYNNEILGKGVEREKKQSTRKKKIDYL